MQSTINEKAPSLKDLQDVEILPASVPAAPDSKTEEEIQDLTQQEADAKLERYKQDTGERKRYANRVYCLVSAWVAAKMPEN